jgi:hypothetical protein
MNELQYYKNLQKINENKLDKIPTLFKSNNDYNKFLKLFNLLLLQTSSQL